MTDQKEVLSRGIECPRCGKDLSRVTTTVKLLARVRRYRKCIVCKEKYSTIEKLVKKYTISSV